MKLGDVVRTLRGAAGLSQTTLAASLDISASYLSLIEANKREPALPLIRQMAVSLGAPAPLLFAAALASDGDDRQSVMQRQVVDQLVDAVRWAIVADRVDSNLDHRHEEKALTSKKKDVMTAYRPPSDLLEQLLNHPSSLYRLERRGKADGRTRMLLVPREDLREAQRQFLDQELAFYQRHPADHCRRRRSVITNAISHRGHAFVSTYDVADCFPTVTPAMVRRALLDVRIGKSRLNDLVLLTTYKDQLPQGAPTSSALLSLVLGPVDEELSQLAHVHGLTYTRYVDDICISGNQPIAFLGQQVLRILVDAGFTLKRTKTRHWVRGEKAHVTGIVLGRRLTVEPQFLQRVKRLVHLLGSGRSDADPCTEAELRGMIDWIRRLEPRAGRALMAQLVEAVNVVERSVAASRDER
jgi:RNA-directed DNA polymerase